MFISNAFAPIYFTRPMPLIVSQYGKQYDSLQEFQGVSRRQ